MDTGKLRGRLDDFDRYLADIERYLAPNA